MSSNAHVLMREQKGKEAKSILDDLVKQYPHTEEATEANIVLDAFKVAEEIHQDQYGEIQAKEIEGALQLFSFDMGRYPTQKEGLRALFANPGIAAWKGPYLEKTRDPNVEKIIQEYDYSVQGETYSVKYKKPADTKEP